MKVKTFIFFILFFGSLFFNLYLYFFQVRPLYKQNLDLKRENDVLMKKLTGELEKMVDRFLDTTSVELPEPLLKAQSELSKDFDVNVQKNYIKITIPTDELFMKGHYLLSKQGKKKLEKFASVLKNIGYKEIEVQVHTDNTPVKTRRDIFPTNWELSARRGTEIVRFLIEKGKIPSDKIYVSAFGSSRPLSHDKNPASQSKNRRAVFIIKFL